MVETGSGYPESGSSGSDPVDKLSGSDPNSASALTMASGSDQSNKLGVLDSDDGIVSPDFLYHNILKD